MKPEQFIDISECLYFVIPCVGGDDHEIELPFSGKQVYCEKCKSIYGIGDDEIMRKLAFHVREAFLNLEGRVDELGGYIKVKPFEERVEDLREVARTRFLKKETN